MCPRHPRVAGGWPGLHRYLVGIFQVVGVTMAPAARWCWEINRLRCSSSLYFFSPRPPSHTTSQFHHPLPTLLTFLKLKFSTHSDIPTIRFQSCRLLWTSSRPPARYVALTSTSDEPHHGNQSYPSLPWSLEGSSLAQPQPQPWEALPTVVDGEANARAHGRHHGNCINPALVDMVNHC